MQLEDKNSLTLKRALVNLGRKMFVGDATIWLLMAILVGFSVVAIYSSTQSLSYAKHDGDINFYLEKQINLILLGTLVLFGTRCIPIKLYKKFTKSMFFIVVCLMVYTLIWGVEKNGARRWMNIGVSIQTSDILRIGLFFMLTTVLYNYRYKVKTALLIPLFELFSFKKNKRKIYYSFKHYSIPIFAPIVISCGLILSQNLSTTLVVGLMSIILLYIGGVKRREIGKFIFVSILGIGLLFGIFATMGIGRVDTWIARMGQFVSYDDPLFDKDGNVVNISSLPMKDFQSVQSDIAIASGQMFGTGLGDSVQRSNLPLAYSDFIFSFIVEEWGALRSFFIIFIYVWIFYRCIVISRKCENKYLSLLCLSMGLLFCGSAFSHVAVCLGIFPVTGLTMPFLSHGGSSAIFSFFVMGVILRISYEQKLEERQKNISVQNDF